MSYHIYKPAFSSFLVSFLISLIPLSSALFLFYLGSTKTSSEIFYWILLIVTILSGLVSLYFLLQDISVHLQRIGIYEDFISIKGLFFNKNIRYSEVVQAFIRERRNAFSRTDHLVVIHSLSGQIILFNSSTLSQNDENNFLYELSKKINLKTIDDKSSL